MKKKLFLIILALFVVLIIGLIAFLVKTGKIFPKAEVAGPSLALEPSVGMYPLGTDFNINIVLDTFGQPADGADVRYLNYNPTELEVQDADSNTTGVQIQAGTVFPNYVGNEVDSATGQIRISGYNNPGADGFVGSGVFATITFRALKDATPSNVTFDFMAGSTSDTNIADHNNPGTDMLAGVINGQYTLGTTQQTHKECANNACTVVDGAGSDQCNADTDCQVTTHKACVGTACSVVSGAGSDECVDDTTCQAQTHSVCSGTTCTSVAGAGVNTCASNADCQGSGGTHHHVCNQAKKTCITVSGPGENSCVTNQDCLPQPSIAPTNTSTPVTEPTSTQTSRPITRVTSQAVSTPTPTPIVAIVSPEFLESPTPEVSASAPAGVTIAGYTLSKPLLILLIVLLAVLLTVIGYLIWDSLSKKKQGVGGSPKDDELI